MGGQGKHRPTGRVERSDHHVDDVDQPRRDGPELDGVGADPPVHDRSRSGRQFPGDPADRRGLDAAPLGDHAPGRSARPGVATSARPLVSSARRPGLVSPSSNRTATMAKSSRRVGAGPDEQVLVGGQGGAGADRVDHHQFPASRLESFDPARPIRGRGQTAVRHERIGAQHQQVVGSIDVGDRDRCRGVRTSVRSKRAWASGRRCWPRRCSWCRWL